MIMFLHHHLGLSCESGDCFLSRTQIGVASSFQALSRVCIEADGYEYLRLDFLDCHFSRPDHLCRLATAGKGLFLAVGDLAEASH
jgi:hypothetical protein